MLHQPKTVRSSRPFHPTKMPQIPAQIPVISGPKDNNAHPDKQAQQQKQRRPSESTTTSAKARPARFPFRRSAVQNKRFPPADTKLTGRGLGRLGLLVLLLGRLGLGLAAHCYWRCGTFVWESGAWVSVLFTAAIIECDELVQIALAKDAKMLIQHELLNDTHRNTHHLLFIRFRNSSSLF